MDALTDEAGAQCPYCGEPVSVEVDPLGPGSETYTEDCPVCCRPWVVHVTRTEDGTQVSLSREDD
jgi:hypothetical protein